MGGAARGHTAPHNIFKRPDGQWLHHEGRARGGASHGDPCAGSGSCWPCPDRWHGHHVPPHTAAVRMPPDRRAAVRHWDLPSQPGLRRWRPGRPVWPKAMPPRSGQAGGASLAGQLWGSSDFSSVTCRHGLAQGALSRGIWWKVPGSVSAQNSAGKGWVQLLQGPQEAAQAWQGEGSPGTARLLGGRSSVPEWAPG